MNYARRSATVGTFLESHFRWQIRTFWFAVLWSVVIWAVSVPLMLDPDRHSAVHRLAPGPGRVDRLSRGARLAGTEGPAADVRMRRTLPLACALLLAGCGQKGPLYLPDKNATVVTSAPATGAPPPPATAAGEEGRRPGRERAAAQVGARRVRRAPDRAAHASRRSRERRSHRARARHAQMLAENAFEHRAQVERRRPGRVPGTGRVPRAPASRR